MSDHPADILEAVEATLAGGWLVVDPFVIPDHIHGDILEATYYASSADETGVPIRIRVEVMQP